MLQLRDYQIDIIEKLREAMRQGHRRIMLYLPTGGGKTECAISLLHHTEQKGNHAAMLMDRRVLCDQTSKRLDKYGIDHGVLMADHWRWRPDRKIQICSAQTLERMETFPMAKMMILDEGHNQRRAINDYVINSNVMTIGLSASPFTKGLGKIYSAVVSGATTQQLVDTGSLAPLRVFIAKEIDMEGAKKVAGEWSDKEATQRGIQITGDIVSEWVKKTHEIFGGPRKTIVFSAGVAHGEDLSRKFAEAGYNFVSISYKDDNEYKQEVMDDFAKPDTLINGLIATDVLTKGFDCPDVMIGISARPFSKSFSSHVQQLGRVMRAFTEKEFAIWICHSGNYLRFLSEWQDLYSNGVDSLDDRNTVKKEKTKKEKEAAKCPKCGALWVGDTCTFCGFVHVGRNEVIVKAGEVEELGTVAKKEKFDMAYKTDWYAQALGYAREKGHNEGSAYYRYKEKFGVGPAGKKPDPKPPTSEFRSWIISRAIARSKAR